MLSLFYTETTFKSVQFQKDHNFLKNNDINKSLCGVLHDNFTFKFYNRSIKTNNTLLKLVKENLPYHTFLRRRQHMLVRHPFKQLAIYHILHLFYTNVMIILIKYTKCIYVSMYI